MLFFEIDITWGKTQHTFISMNFTPNLIAITIPEETRHSGRQDTSYLFKYKI